MKQDQARAVVTIVTATAVMLWIVGFIATGFDPVVAVLSGLVWFCFGMMARSVT